VQAKFHDSIVDLISNGISANSSSKVTNNHSVPVYVTYKSNTLYIGSNKQNVSEFQSPWFKVLLRRPPACPFLALKTSSYTPPVVSGRNIQVASVVLLESSDSMVLLTKRPASMRTFPNVWVPPGGQVEHDEDLFDAALRELKEETSLDHEAIDIGQPNLLGLWESGFPLQFSREHPPKRHHVVSYVHFKTSLNASELNTRLKPQPSEVDKAAWVCRCVARKIVLTDDNLKIDDCLAQDTCCSSICPFVDGSDKRLLGAEVRNSICSTNNIPIEPLLNRYSSFKDASSERVSTGTKFALYLWLKGFCTET